MRVAKSARNFLMVLALVSEDGSMDGGDLGDYMASHLQDPISRVEGVGEIQLCESQYAMRIWLDPSKMHQYGLTPNDVASAIEAQNAKVSAGQLGAIPALKGQQLNVTVNVQSRLNTPEAFGNVLLLTKANGATVRLRDVARIELGNEDYEKAARYNGQPAAGMAIRLATGANALETAERVRARLKELESFYPAGVQTVFPYDSTPFVRISIEEVVKTLAEAVVLVRVRTLADQDDLVAKGIKHAGTGYIESTLAQGRMLLEDLGASDNDVSELVDTLRENGYAMIRDANAKA